MNRVVVPARKAGAIFFLGIDFLGFLKVYKYRLWRQARFSCKTGKVEKKG
jgi:hypothetical protein